MKSMLVSDLTMNGGTQPRAELDESVIEEYADAVRNGVEFPPPVAFYDGYTYWLADGFHRVRAYEKADHEPFDCEVHQGTQRDAILYSVGANEGHGVRRKPGDRKRAVLTLLRDEEWSQWSDAKIAELCAVTRQYVSKLRPSTKADTRNRCESTSRKGADGRTQSVSAGKRSSSAKAAAERRKKEPEPAPVDAIGGSVESHPAQGEQGADADRAHRIARHLIGEYGASVARQVADAIHEITETEAA